MKHLILYVAALAGLLLGGGSCSKEQTAGGTEGYGRVEMALSTTRSDEGGYDPFEHLAVRIYNADGGLIRQYDSQEALPSSLELLAGDYRIEVELGEELPASFDARCSRGAESFTARRRGVPPVEHRRRGQLRPHSGRELQRGLPHVGCRG